MCVCVYAYACVYTRAYAYVYTHTHTHTHTHIHLYMCTYKTPPMTPGLDSAPTRFCYCGAFGFLHSGCPSIPNPPPPRPLLRLRLLRLHLLLLLLLQGCMRLLSYPPSQAHTVCAQQQMRPSCPKGPQLIQQHTRVHLLECVLL
jgi:hypothetical protein